jgi:hypothetical protein
VVRLSKHGGTISKCSRSSYSLLTASSTLLTYGMASNLSVKVLACVALQLSGAPSLGVMATERSCCTADCHAWSDVGEAVSAPASPRIKSARCGRDSHKQFPGLLFLLRSRVFPSHPSFAQDVRPFLHLRCPSQRVCGRCYFGPLLPVQLQELQSCERQGPRRWNHGRPDYPAGLHWPRCRRAELHVQRHHWNLRVSTLRCVKDRTADR